MESTLIVVVVAVGVIVIFGVFTLFSKFYRRVEQGYAMIVVKTGRDEPDVTFTERMVYPIIHKAELMDISRKAIKIERTRVDGLICRDNIRADIKATFFVQVNRTVEGVLRVAQGVGCARASNRETLGELFSAKFSEAMEIVAKSMDFVDLCQERDKFRDEIKCLIGFDLSGYELVDVAIDYLEQTPLSHLDPNNIFDAQGIKKITEITAQENARANEYKKQIAEKDVETCAAILEIEINRDRAIEVQKKAIADVIRERVSVERTVAEQEEAIKEIRAIAGAERIRKSATIIAEAAAAENLIKDIKEHVTRELTQELIGFARSETAHE